MHHFTAFNSDASVEQHSNVSDMNIGFTKKFLFLVRNSIRFTPTQVEAVRAGTNYGLTMVVGPPGTGKTDVAVQIISNLYHNFPDQRTLIVTHSNQVRVTLYDQ